MVAADSSHDGSNVGEACTVDDTTLLNSEVGKPSLEGIQSKEIAATGLSNDNDDNIHMEIGKIDFNNGVCQETTESDDPITHADNTSCKEEVNRSTCNSQAEETIDGHTLNNECIEEQMDSNHIDAKKSGNEHITLEMQDELNVDTSDKAINDGGVGEEEGASNAHMSGACNVSSNPKDHDELPSFVGDGKRKETTPTVNAHVGSENDDSSVRNEAKATKPHPSLLQSLNEDNGSSNCHVGTNIVDRNAQQQHPHAVAVSTVRELASSTSHPESSQGASSVDSPFIPMTQQLPDFDYLSQVSRS